MDTVTLASRSVCRGLVSNRGSPRGVQRIILFKRPKRISDKLTKVCRLGYYHAVYTTFNNKVANFFLSMFLVEFVVFAFLLTHDQHFDLPEEITQFNSS